MNFRDLQKMFDLQGRIRKVSESLDRLKNGALVAFTGGTIALGLIGGGIFWLPAAMAGSLLVYRFGLFAMDYRLWQQQRRLQQVDEIKKRMEELETANLSDAGRQLLGSALQGELEIVAPRKALPPGRTN
jgi:hypothetical protein